MKGQLWDFSNQEFCYPQQVLEPILSQFSSVTQLCPTLCDLVDCSTPGFPVCHQLPELAQTLVHRVSDAIQPSRPLSSLLLPSVFPSIRVFFNESVFHIKWPKYWSFSFSISPSNEYSGLAMNIQPKKIKSVTVFITSPSICHEVMGINAVILVFRMLSFKPTVSLSSFTRGSLVLLRFLP